MKAFLKGAAHLLGIWIVIAFTFAAAAFMMATCDVLREPVHYARGTT